MKIKYIAPAYRRTRIYIAGPYTAPDPCINTNVALKMADTLWELGYAPFVPHLCHFWHTMSPHPYEMWTEYVAEFLSSCDAVLRIPGDSTGSDKEVAYAKNLGIPVFYSLSTLQQEFPIQLIPVPHRSFQS